jgi:hypothetical protein
MILDFLDTSFVTEMAGRINEVWMSFKDVMFYRFNQSKLNGNEVI